MLEEAKVRKFVSKLAEDTASGSLNWEAASSFQLQTGWGRNNAIGPIYITHIANNQIIAYRMTYKHWHDEENYDDAEDVSVEFVNSSGTKTWSVADVPQRHKLLDAIEFRVSGAESTIDSYLGDDDETE
ncbi:hypothetical protein ETAA8_68380 [Anatilimnocola aggregata]|uniref:Uncharacterized protein n=1 Tax=Anatilimnocola aggregata TaxID=2528021 RepID=A0A517YN86_9BACT|nr:hypothetical protein [Anatilimnocola aggregata]QDU31678.1 hypothetical protein ETAA8_68380 [Anatilimnocola aggregata]